MTFKEKMRFTMANQLPDNLELAQDVIDKQGEIIDYLIEQKRETFALYRQLENTHQKLKGEVHRQMIDAHTPDKFSN